MKMDEESIPLTTFSTPQGHYKWIVIPFGLKNAPQIFQRRMDNIFKDHNHCCLVSVSYTHLRAHETDSYLVCRLLLEKKTSAIMLNKKLSF